MTQNNPEVPLYVDVQVITEEGAEVFKAFKGQSFFNKWSCSN